MWSSVPFFGATLNPNAPQRRVQKVRVEIGGHAVLFELGPTGRAVNDDGTFQATNADRFGFLYGEQMEFLIRLKGAPEVFVKTGSEQAGKILQPVPVKIAIADIQHTATFSIRFAK